LSIHSLHSNTLQINLVSVKQYIYIYIYNSTPLWWCDIIKKHTFCKFVGVSHCTFRNWCLKLVVDHVVVSFTKTVTHSPCTVCAWHLKTISFASHVHHSHHYTFQLKAKFHSLPVPHCISCISSVTHSSLAYLFGNMLWNRNATKH